VLDRLVNAPPKFTSSFTFKFFHCFSSTLCRISAENPITRSYGWSLLINTGCLSPASNTCNAFGFIASSPTTFSIVNMLFLSPTPAMRGVGRDERCTSFSTESW
jgi:hypothetical protein